MPSIDRPGDPDEAYIRIPVRITREDVERLDRCARANGVTLGWFLDIIISDRANDLRRNAGEPPIQSPFLSPTDRWHMVRPS